MIKMTDIQKELLMPFDPKQVHWRVGATTGDDNNKKGIALGYLDARDVMERLDQVVGIQNWQARYPFTGCCEVGIRTTFLLPAGLEFSREHWEDLNSQFVWKANAAGETQVEAEKGQASDAFKRAAVLWGIGRCYYDLPNTWNKLEKRGRSWILPKDVKEQLSSRLGAWQEQWIKQNIK